MRFASTVTRNWLAVAILATGAAFQACDLNPQPIPPMSKEADKGGAGMTGSSSGGDRASPSEDAASFADAGVAASSGSFASGASGSSSTGTGGGSSGGSVGLSDAASVDDTGSDVVKVAIEAGETDGPAEALDEAGE